MKLLLTLKESNVEPGSKNKDSTSFDRRQAARAVVFNHHGQVALLRVNLHGYHKLPGGGVEKGEDIDIALERELMEEIGCEASVTAEVGEIMEYRDQFELIQTSYCFIVEQVGVQKPPTFTDEEVAEDFEIVWADNLDAAIKLVEADKTQDYEGKFITRRDLVFLKAAKALDGPN